MDLTAKFIVGFCQLMAHVIKNLHPHQGYYKGNFVTSKTSEQFAKYSCNFAKIAPKLLNKLFVSDFDDFFGEAPGRPYKMIS